MPSSEPFGQDGPVWTVVGSGTLLPSRDRGSPAHLLEAGGEVFLLDCGPGTVHGLARWGCPWMAVTRVWISHFHVDHIGDLPGLAWAWKHGGRRRPEVPLELLGPPGMLEVWAGLAAAFGDWMAAPGGPVRVREMTGTDPVPLSGGLVVAVLDTPHTPESRALRLTSPEDGWTVVYTGDTGATPDLVPFMEGADLVVAACARPDPPGEVPHLTPGALGPLLEAAGVRRVVTTHAYPELPPSAVPDLLRDAGYTGRTTVGRDGLRIPLRATES